MPWVPPSSQRLPVFFWRGASFCWKMWRELATLGEAAEAAEEVPKNADLKRNGTILGGAPTKTFAQAATQILTADVSMSLDNVLAAAGAAHGHPT